MHFGMSLLDKPYWCILSGVTQEDTYMGLALSLHRGIVCLAAFWVLPLPSPPPLAGLEPTPTIQSDQPLAALYPLSYEQGYVGPRQPLAVTSYYMRSKEEVFQSPNLIR